MQDNIILYNNERKLFILSKNRIRQIYWNGNGERFYLKSRNFRENDILFLLNNLDKDTNLNEFRTVLKIDFSLHPLVFLVMETIQYLNEYNRYHLLDIISEQLCGEIEINNTKIVKSFISVAKNIMGQVSNFPEIKRELIENIESELNVLDTFVEYIELPYRMGHLEIHGNNDEKRVKSEINKLDFTVNVKIENVKITSRFNDGVQVDEHGGVPFHFHYCTKVNYNTFHRSRYLLTYNTENDKYLYEKEPTLYWEIHSEKKANKNINLPMKDERRKAIYHRCNAFRVEVSNQGVRFRNRSDNAEVYYP